MPARWVLPSTIAHGGVEDLEEPPFDLVVSLEVIEHVTDPALFLGHIARLLKPDGLLILSTPNRTPLSKLMIVTLAEGLGRIPKGTHDWSKFITPEELTSLLSVEGLAPQETRGIAFDPRTGFVLNDRLDLNYIMTGLACDRTEPDSKLSSFATTFPSPSLGNPWQTPLLDPQSRLRTCSPQ